MKGIPIGFSLAGHSTVSSEKAPDLHAPWISRDGFLFHPATGLTYQLNESGSVIFEMLSAGAGFAEIIDLLVERFDVDISTARQDVRDFVSSVRALGLHSTTGA